MPTGHHLKINELREEIRSLNLDGFLIPSNDEFQSEYIPEFANRLKYITNFSGSNGLALITLDKAIFFTDGRYILQAKLELDKEFIIQNISNLYTSSLLFGNIGYDPKLHSSSNIQKYTTCNLIACNNLVDEIWLNKPKAKTSKIFKYPYKYAGETATSKLSRIQNYLKAANIDALIITDPYNLCWLLNIRAHDVEYNPVLLSYAIFYQNGKLDLFSNHKDHLSFSELSNHLKLLQNKKVQIDPRSASMWIKSHLQEPILKDDPCIIAKACKNNIEVSQSRNIHIIDGAALTKALYWIEKNYKKQPISEISISNKLLELRSKCTKFLYPSFSTIAGFQEHGAIIHYKAQEKSNKIISGNGLLLIDSGGQYFGGTTDITRTILIGKATYQQKLDFTLVLKGHIALARAVFPEGIKVANLDVLARQFLWKQEKDYAHGTGHGVGNCLNVHEGLSDGALKKGMILSNEPGYYKNGEYGIRIENLMLVKELKNKFLGFETLSLAPIDRKLILAKALSKEEKIWLNAYHHKIYSKLSPFMNREEKTWLRAKTFEISLDH